VDTSDGRRRASGILAAAAAAGAEFRLIRLQQLAYPSSSHVVIVSHLTPNAIAVLGTDAEHVGCKTIYCNTHLCSDFLTVGHLRSGAMCF
jgi:hypothetical protein